MNSEISPKLKVAVKQIEAILREHDIMGTVVLADGEGHSEWRLFIDTPSWTMIRFLKEGAAVHIKGYGKSKPIETNKTINAIFSILDVTERVFLMADAIRKKMKETMDIEEDKGTWYGPEGEPIT